MAAMFLVIIIDSFTGTKFSGDTQITKVRSTDLTVKELAHDLKNFVHVVSAHTNKIKGFTDDERIIRRSDLIISMCQKTSALVANFVALTKDNNIHQRQLDLSREVENCVTLLQDVLPDNVDCMVSTGRDLPLILGDTAQICRLITNLTINAVDAMPDGGEIKIETAKTTLSEDECPAHTNARPGEFVSLTVSDTGSGISKETLSRVFQPYFSTKQKRVGKGLGLASVHSIVEAHSGWVEVESIPGKGTAFKILFPATNGKRLNMFTVRESGTQRVENLNERS
jgi:signal transduction histidine kinase